MPKDEGYKNLEQGKWQPGQSGNPAGMKRGTEHTATRLKRLLHAVQKAKNPVTKETEEFTTLELMDAALIARALKGDVTAYREILDRLEGRVPQKTEIAGSLNVTAERGELTAEQAAKIRAIMEHGDGNQKP